MTHKGADRDARPVGGAATASAIPPVEAWLDVARSMPDLDVDLAAVATTLRFQRAADGLFGAFEEFFAGYDLSDGRFTLLMILLMKPPDWLDPTPSELAERVGVSRATITSLLDGLERAHLVARAAHPTDRRRLVVRLTEDGRALMARLLPDYFRHVGTVADHLDDAERQQLDRLLSKLYLGIPRARQP